MGLMTTKTEILNNCGWPDKPFKFVDEPGEHNPCYAVMPDGACLVFNHHDSGKVDINRANFIIDACNTALDILQPDKMTKDEAIKFLETHASWLSKEWSLTPEGREYHKQFLKAIEGLK
jgi:hypothetical protein